MLRLFLFISFFNLSLKSQPAVNETNNLFPKKTLHIIVDEIGIISIGRDTVSSDELARYIQERLFKNYMGTGNMYDQILFSKANNEVPEMIVEVVLNEIRLGQQRALTELCLTKHNDRFENISSRQQAKLKKHFPVLFQTKYN